MNAGVPAAAAPAHGEPLARGAAQARLGLRPRDRDGVPRGRRRCRPRVGRLASCTSASSGSTAGSGRSTASCPRCSPRRARASTRSWCRPANADEARARARASTVIGVASLLEAAIRHGGRFDDAASRDRAGAAPRAASRPAPTTAGDLADVVGQRATPSRRSSRRRPAGTTSSCSARPARARRCSRRGCPGSCPTSTHEAALEVASMHSLAGRPLGSGLSHSPAVRGARTTPRPPRRWSAAAAGSSGPGAAARASHGVLFLDEAPEFPPPCSTRCGSRWSPGTITHPPGERGRHVPGPVPARARRQPVPVRQHGVERRETAPARRPCAAATSRASPGRCSTASTSSSGCRASPRPACAWRRSNPALSTAEARARVDEARARGRGTAARTRRGARTPQMPGPWLRGAGGLHPGGRATRRARPRARARRHHHARLRPGAQGRLDPRRPRRRDPARRRPRRPGALPQKGDIRMSIVPRSAADRRGAAVAAIRPAHDEADPRRGVLAGAARLRWPSPATACSAGSIAALGAGRRGGRAAGRRRAAGARRAGRGGGRAARRARGRRRASSAGAAARPRRVRAVARARPRGSARASLDARRSAWPAGVDELGVHAPLALWVRGRARGARRVDRPIALVGARAATGYGEHVAMEASAGLVDRGFAVVSGGAYGIDGMAHRAALASRRHDRRLPRRRRRPLLPARARAPAHPDRRDRGGRLRAAVRGRADEVAVPAAEQADRRRQPMATVVLEAGHAVGLAQHGGARGGARPAARRGARVRSTSPASAGCHRLLREYDAVCVVDADQMAELASAGAARVRPSATNEAGLARAAAWSAGADRHSMSPERLRVLDAMSTRSPRDVDDIARRAGSARDDRDGRARGARRRRRRRLPRRAGGFGADRRDAATRSARLRLG